MGQNKCCFKYIYIVFLVPRATRRTDRGWYTIYDETPRTTMSVTRDDNMDIIKTKRQRFACVLYIFFGASVCCFECANNLQKDLWR